MLSENIKRLRTAKGMSQEELAKRLNVVRQTISKWEKNLSVPDSEMLIRLSEEFGTTVSELLDRKNEKAQADAEITEQLSRIKENLEIKNRRRKKSLKILMWIAISVLAITIIWITLGSVADIQYSQSENTDIVFINEFCFIEDKTS